MVTADEDTTAAAAAAEAADAAAVTDAAATAVARPNVSDEFTGAHPRDRPPDRRLHVQLHVP